MKLRSLSVKNPFLVCLSIIALVFMSALAPLSASAASSKSFPHFSPWGPISLKVGDTYTFKVNAAPKGATYSWMSNRKAVATVDQNGSVLAVGAGEATISVVVATGSKKHVVASKVIVKGEAMKPDANRVPVDATGRDANGRMVAYFGSPIVDGTIDPIWEKAEPIVPKHISEDLAASVVFKALWDDNALYILADVKDKQLSVESTTPYMQDSVEIFLDEDNDKTKTYGPDDLHIRINYENLLTIDNGKPKNYYTAAKKTKDGYVVETRIALKDVAKNDTVFGIELQLNDAVGPTRVGGVNVFDGTGTAWNDPSQFGEVLLTGKTDKDVSGNNPYDLLNLIKSTMKLNFKLYTNAGIVSDAVASTVTDQIFAKNGVTQKQIDEQQAALQAALDQLVMTEEAANEKYFTALPDEYRNVSDRAGSVETLHYQTPNTENGQDDKKLHVYLPYGYDAKATDKKYNVLYMMHGGGENEDLLFGGPGQEKELKRIIDNMIAKGEIEPLIVVTPTFNGGKKNVAVFHEEMLAKIIPLVETKYNTHAKSGSLEDLKASRAHRAMGGFSQGSVTTWHAYNNALDYIKYFIPLSGGASGTTGVEGGSSPKETAEFLANIAKKAGYKPTDYYIFGAAGDMDFTHAKYKLLVNEMRLLTDSFIYSSNTKKGNFYFIEAEGGTHAWGWQNQFIYDILPDLFK